MKARSHIDLAWIYGIERLNQEVESKIYYLFIYLFFFLTEENDDFKKSQIQHAASVGILISAFTGLIIQVLFSN